MLRDNLTVVSPELRKLRTRWANPAFPSPVSAAQAVVQLATVFPELATSDVGLEMAGFTESQITRLSQERKRQQSSALLAALSAVQTPAVQPAVAAPVPVVTGADNAG
jgi:hypothetical protein